MIHKTPRQSCGSTRKTVLAVSVTAALALSGHALAFEIDTGNPDLSVRWDNSLRYNAGWRVQHPHNYLMTPAAGAGAADYKFRQYGGMVTNRIDDLSEFDFIWKQDTGFRVSAALWYDKRYDNNNLQAVPGGATPFRGNTYPPEIKRYYKGPSGQILDAFVFTKVDLGDVPVNMKLGQHTIYWGETLFSLADGIAYSQSNADLRKALANPGVEAKEVFKPLDQFSFSAAISDKLQVMGQYYFDYQPDLFPLGGTYFSPVDFLVYNGDTVAAPGAINWNGTQYNGMKKSGDWGLGAKWRPDWLDGTAGFYFREFTPKNAGALNVNLLGLGGSVFSGGAAPAQAGLWLDSSAPRTKLIGISLGKLVGANSIGIDLSYRKDSQLETKPFTFINGSPLLPAAALGASVHNGISGWAPLGDVWAGTLNSISYFGKTPMFDSAVLTAELDYDAIQKVTKNIQNWGGRPNCIKGTSLLNGAPANQGYYGCQTGQSYSVDVLFEPKWFQVWGGVDVSMPLFYSVGLHGNSAMAAVGANEGQGAYSAGLSADVNASWTYTLAYNGFLGKHRFGAGDGAPITNAALGDFSDRNWVSFTVKTTF